MDQERNIFIDGQTTNNIVEKLVKESLQCSKKLKDLNINYP